jgi:hypothetical protein
MVERKREHGANLAGKSTCGGRRLRCSGVQDRKVGETPSRPLRVAAGSLHMELEVGGGFHALKVGGDAV